MGKGDLEAIFANPKCVETLTGDFLDPPTLATQKRAQAIIRYLAETDDKDSLLHQKTKLLARILVNAFQKKNKCATFIRSIVYAGSWDVPAPKGNENKGALQDLVVAALSDEQLQGLPWKCLSSRINEYNTEMGKRINDCISALKEAPIAEFLKISAYIQGVSEKGMNVLLARTELQKNIDAAQLKALLKRTNEWDGCKFVNAIEHLPDLNHAAAITIPLSCVTSMTGWDSVATGADTKLKAALANLSPTLFESVGNADISEHFYKHMSQTQLENYDSKLKNEKCAKLKLGILNPDLSVTLNEDCLKNAVSSIFGASPKPKVILSEKLIASNSALFDTFTKEHLDCFDLKNLATNGKKKQLQKLLSLLGPTDTKAVPELDNICKAFKILVNFKTDLGTMSMFVIEKLPWLCLKKDGDEGFKTLKSAQIQKLDEVLSVIGIYNDISWILGMRNFKLDVLPAQFSKMLSGNSGQAAKHCDQIEASSLAGFSNDVLVAMKNECFQKQQGWNSIKPAHAQLIVQHLADDFFSIVPQALDKNVFAHMKPEHVANFDTHRSFTPHYCQHMQLASLRPELSSALTPECFAMALSQSNPAAPIELAYQFAAHARADLFEKITDGTLLANIKLYFDSKDLLHQANYQNFWHGLEKELVKKALALFKDMLLHPVVTYGLSYSIRQLYSTDPSTDIFHGKQPSEWDAYPVTIFLDESVLNALGPRNFGAFSRVFEDRNAPLLLEQPLIKKHLTKEQLERLLSPVHFSRCQDISVNLLVGMAPTLLSSIDPRCIATLRDWKGFAPADAVRQVVPFLSDVAFGFFFEELSETATRHLTAAQLSHFGEQNDHSRCSMLALEAVNAYFSASIGPHCFDNAPKAKPLSRIFFRHAIPNLFSEVTDLSTLDNKVLKTGESWGYLNAKQMESLLAIRDGAACARIRVPPLGQLLQLPANFDAKCLEAMDNGELLKLFASDSIQKVDEGIFSELTAAHVIDAGELASLALRRPKLLASFGKSALPNICSQYKLAQVSQLGRAITHLPSNCLSSIEGIAQNIRMDAYLKLPRPIQDVIPVESFLAAVNFKTIKADEFRRLTEIESVCPLLEADKARQVKDWSFLASGRCLSTVLFPLVSEEVAKSQDIAQVSAEFVRTYARHFTVVQMGKLDKNAGGILALSSLSAEQVNAISPSTIKFIQPIAFASLDDVRFAAFSPEAIAAMSVEQASQVPKPVLAKISVKQAPRLSPQVAALFDAELRAQLAPEIAQVLPQSTASLLSRSSSALIAGVTLLALWLF